MSVFFTFIQRVLMTNKIQLVVKRHNDITQWIFRSKEKVQLWMDLKSENFIIALYE